MREIKFRAWDGEKMRAVFGLTPISLCYEEESTYPVTYRKRDGIEIMQYTGLKDKNGKEIYEGDILNVTPHRLPFQISFRIDNAGWWLHEPTTNRWEPMGVNDNYLWEIIGNVWENPELLTA